MPDGYFLKQWCRLWEITPDSQQLTNRTAHLACFKHGQMCITLTQRTDIQRYLHQHCTTTSKTVSLHMSEVYDAGTMDPDEVAFGQLAPDRCEVERNYEAATSCQVDA